MTGPTDDPHGSGDELVRAMALDGRLRALAVVSTGVGQRLMELHKAQPTSAAALTRIATAALLLGGTIKGRAQISIEIKGEGILGELYAIADAHGHVRATIEQPFVHVPASASGKLDVAGAIGAGTLRVTKILGVKEPYQSVVPLVHGGIAQDLAHYFLTSEQKPAAMALGERVSTGRVQAAGGFLIQAFPGVADSELEQVEQAVTNLPPLSELLEGGIRPEALLRRVLPDALVLERYPVSFRCTCSRQRYESILISLGVDELRDMAAGGDDTELTCNFCNTSYMFSPTDLSALLAEASRREAGS